MAFSCTAELDRGRWDSFVAAHPGGHLLQSHAWGELKSAFGWEALRLALLDAGEVCAVAQVLFRRAAGFSVAYVPRGPVVDWADDGAVTALLEAISEAGRARRAIFLKIEPNLPEAEAFLRLAKSLGFRPARIVQPRSTIVLDLTVGEETLLAQMKPKTRYNVRLASRRGVTVRPARGSEEVALFYDLLLETALRDEFGVHTLAYYQEAYRLLNEADQGVLLFAELEGEVLAALWVAAFGPEAIYLYGASRSAGQRHMPTYLLQWEAMRWALERGCVRYDLWGVPESLADEQHEGLDRPEKNVRDGLWGVFRFKQGFGGGLQRTVGAFDLPYWPGLYRLYRGLLGG